MPINEFSLIEKYFRRESSRADVLVGIGDDAAVLSVPNHHELVAAIDTLVAGIHFPEKTSPFDIGYKSLAVNLSDLAAMGAMPAWATLALTLPEANDKWLEQFASGFFTAADEHDVALVGGDTTRGPLTISVQLQGYVPSGNTVRRSGAQAGDHILVTGALGDAGLGLGYVLGQREGNSAAVGMVVARLNRPTARIAAGLALRQYAKAMIDISDGLLADLGHVLDASQCGAQINIDAVPRSPAFCELVSQQQDDWNRLPLTAGDDFELLCCVPEQELDVVQTVADEMALPITDIGRIETSPGLRCVDQSGKLYQPAHFGYQHFS